MKHPVNRDPDNRSRPNWSVQIVFPKFWGDARQLVAKLGLAPAMMVRLAAHFTKIEIPEPLIAPPDENRMIYRLGKKTLIAVVKPGLNIYGRGNIRKLRR